MKLPIASCGVSPVYSAVVALLDGCTQPQQAAGYSDKIKIICLESMVIDDERV